MDRTQLISLLEREMQTNTQWLRIHAAEALLDNKESVAKVAATFVPEAATASAPYRIGVWRVLARSTTGKEHVGYIQRIQKVLHDSQATDRISAAETLGKLDAADRADRPLIEEWLKTAEDAAAVYPSWLMVLSANREDRAKDEDRLLHFLHSADPIARLRAAFALGRLREIPSSAHNALAQQLEREPKDSIARVYLISALLLHAHDKAATENLEAEFAAYARGKANEQLEFGIVTGLRGGNNALTKLSPQLNDAEPDARIGAANGMLRLLK